MRHFVSLFSLSNHGQIGNPMTVLESAGPEDSETPPESLIWSSFSWEIKSFAHLDSFQKLTSFHKNWNKIVCNLWFLNHFFIKFQNQGQFKHLLFMGIQNLSLIFNFDKEMIEIPKVTDNFVSILMKRCQFFKWD